MTYYCWFTDPLVDFLFQNSGRNCPQLVRVYCDLTDLTKNSLVSVPLILWCPGPLILRSRTALHCSLTFAVFSYLRARRPGQAKLGHMVWNFPFPTLYLSPSKEKNKPIIQGNSQWSPCLKGNGVQRLPHVSSEHPMSVCGYDAVTLLMFSTLSSSSWLAMTVRLWLS